MYSWERSFCEALESGVVVSAARMLYGVAGATGARSPDGKEIRSAIALIGEHAASMNSV
jgi:hypothetical protein